MAKAKKRASSRKKNSKRAKASVKPARKKVSKRGKASVKPARKTVAKRAPPKKAKSKVRRKNATISKLEAEAKQVPEVVAETKLPEVVEERLPDVTAETIVVEVAAETTVIDVIEEPAPDVFIFEERKIA
jgi:hypothetical protein